MAGLARREAAELADHGFYRRVHDLLARRDRSLRRIGADAAVRETAAIIFRVEDRSVGRDLGRHLHALLRIGITEIGDGDFARRGVTALAHRKKLAADVVDAV